MIFKNMSLMPNSTSYMAQTIRNGSSNRETFHKYFECWISEQDQLLQELVSASKNHEDHLNNGRNGSGHVETIHEVDDRFLRPLIQQVIHHYEQYYRTKATWARNNVLDMFNPSWRSSLEDAFMWIGGWRPSMAFHLLYSKSGLQVEYRLAELLQGFSTGDLGDLSPSQFDKVNEIQRETIRKEKDISEKLAKQQESVADSTMVELSHALTDLVREGEVEQVKDQGRVDAALGPKEEGLVEILKRADDLRLDTIRNVLDEILNPIQGVHFLIAAAELHLRFHEWGKKRDARSHNHPQPVEHPSE